MTMSPIEPPDAGRSAQRRAVRRLTGVLIAIALVIYVLFVASGVFAWRGLPA